MQISQLREKLNNPHLLSLVTNGSMAALSIITYSVICRTLPLHERGVWLLFQSTVILTDCLRSGFLSTGFIGLYSGLGKGKARLVAGSAWYIASLITLGFCLLNIPTYLLAYHVADGGIALFMRWFGVVSLVSLPFFMATCLVQAQGRFDRLLKLRLINMLAFLACIVFFHFIGESSVKRTIHSYVIALLAGSLFALFSGWSGIGSIWKKRKKDVLELYHFGKYTVGTSISFNLFWFIDNLIIESMLGYKALAICDVAAKLLEFIEIPLRSFAASGLPILSAAYNNDEPQKVITTMKRIAGILTVVMVPGVLLAIFFADYAIAVIGGVQYVHTQAEDLFKLFILFSLLYPTDRFMALTLDAIHRPKVNFIKVLIMLAVTVVADYLGIYLTGDIFGVAYASVLPVLTAIVISFFALQSYQRFGFLSIYIFGAQEIWRGAMTVLKRK